MEIACAQRISLVKRRSHDDLLTDVALFLLDNHEKDGYLGREVALEAESRMAPIPPEAKHCRMLCVSHAHIDMLWL